MENSKAFLSNRGTNINKITSADNNKIISDDKQPCKTFSNFFQDAVKTLGVSDSFNISNYPHSYPVNNAIRNYENHPSVKKICETITITSTFHFSEVDKADVEKSIGNLNSSKVGTFENIPAKYLKATSDICSPFLQYIWKNELILNKTFPQTW